MNHPTYTQECFEKSVILKVNEANLIVRDATNEDNIAQLIAS